MTNRIEPLDLLRQLGGYYECPKDFLGKRLGPLVGYAGRDKTGRQYVGDIYANFAKAEQHPMILEEWAEYLAASLPSMNVCLGMPMGGILFAAAIARAYGCQAAFAEKKVTALATATEREQSKLVLARHDLRPKDGVVLVEDVVNNFSTTAAAIQLVKDRGAKVVAIACILNRSGDTSYCRRGWEDTLIYSVVHRHFPEYAQDDPEVRDDIAAGNVVWKPKEEWDKLPV